MRSLIAVVTARCFFCALAILGLASSRAAAQVEVAGNEYVRVSVSTVANAGRFWINAGPAIGSHRLLFGNSFLSSSNIIFRIVDAAGSVHYYSNIPEDFPFRPKLPGGAEEVAFAPYDSLHASTDTIAYAWRNLSGFSVVVRFIPERARSPYQNGADVLMEFSYRQLAPSPTAKIGVLLMLDSYSAQAGGVNGISAIVSDRHVVPVGAGGRIYSVLRDTIPQFYHAGDPLYNDPPNTLLAVHRLQGVSHNGASLTPPFLTAIGDLDVLRATLWDPDSTLLATTPLEDCAALVRWDNLAGIGTVRTAFGSSDRAGNNYYVCRDSSVFVVMETTTRTVEQIEQGGPFFPPEFRLSVWIANTSAVDSVRSMTVTLDAPAPQDGLVIDSTGGVERVVVLGRNQVAKVEWRLSMAPNAKVLSADVPLTIRYLTNDQTYGSFREVCAPVITVSGIPKPDEDTLAPLLTRTGHGTVPTQYWAYMASDRHAGYAFDTGLDTVRVVPGASANVTVSLTGLTRCSVSSDAGIRVEVIDTNRPARYLLALYDCRGNVSYDSASFKPTPRDTASPLLVRLDSTSTSWTFGARDSHEGYEAFDTGIDSVWAEPGSLDNFMLQVAAFRRCDQSSDALFLVSVVDTTRSADVVVIVKDCGGNVSRDTIQYRPRPAGVDTRFSDAGARAIIAVTPQPLRLDGARRLRAVVQGFAAVGTTAELISIDGIPVARNGLACEPAGATFFEWELPRDIAPGVYLLRVRDSEGERSVKVVLVR